MVPPILQDLLGAEEQCGADRRLIETADVGPAGSLRFQRPEKLQGQVHLWETPIDPRDVVLHEEEETGEPAALQETRLGLLGAGDGDPYPPLRVAQRAPPGRDRAESPADSTLSGGAGIVRDKRGVGILAIAVALPDCVPAFSRLRNVVNSHNSDAGAPASRPGNLPGDYATAANGSINSSYTIWGRMSRESKGKLRGLNAEESGQKD